MSFATLGLLDILVDPLVRLGCDKPAPHSNERNPIVARGRDLMARAQTSTARMAAFGLPIIVRARQPHISGAPRGFVLVPTRELAAGPHQDALRRVDDRGGRTGRAGHTGRAVSFVSVEDRGQLRAIQRLLPSPIQEERAPARI